MNFVVTWFSFERRTWNRFCSQQPRHSLFTIFSVEILSYQERIGQLYVIINQIMVSLKFLTSLMDMLTLN